MNIEMKKVVESEILIGILYNQTEGKLKTKAYPIVEPYWKRLKTYNEEKKKLIDAVIEETPEAYWIDQETLQRELLEIRGDKSSIAQYDLEGWPKNILRNHPKYNTLQAKIDELSGHSFSAAGQDRLTRKDLESFKFAHPQTGEKVEISNGQIDILTELGIVKPLGEAPNKKPAKSGKGAK